MLRAFSPGYFEGAGVSRAFDPGYYVTRPWRFGQATIHPWNYWEIQAMNSNAVLRELWAIRERLDEEAGHDLGRFCQQLRSWEKTNCPDGLVLVSPSTIKASMAKEKEADQLALREPPAAYGSKPKD
jgi:hypothetical protein